MNKKIIWIFIILVLVIIGAGIYFWLAGDKINLSSVIKQSPFDSIPQPPALPE
ncbi:MAG: hypothetical protein UR22_C0008G0007 [Parcubacteria group bacterium GW2011_GWC2_32_10]|nr:MAG: hypothetical protein UR22_C0008G0007 [Parcubacteria group bacterium GW2011_GWC2_32_10]